MPVKGIASALRACRRHFYAAASFSALLNLLFIAPMLYMLQVYDRVVPTQGHTTLFFLTLVVVFALVTLSLLDFVRSRLLVRASVRLDRNLSGVILDTTLSTRGSTIDIMRKQALREFDTLRQALTGPAILALFDAPWTPIYILICFLIHPAIGVLVIVGAILLALIALRNEQATSGPLKKANEAAGRAYATQEQVLAGAEVVRALGMRQAMVQRHLGEREAMMSLQTRASFAASKYVSLSKFLRLAIQSLALGLGAWLAIDNKITAGAIFAASFLAGRALQPIDQVLGSWRSVVQAREAYTTLNSLLASNQSDTSTTLLPDPVGHISVEQLVVLNSTGDAAILAGLSFVVEPGEVVAVIGPSGAGKSTLLRMLAGAGKADRGLIRFDGADSSDWDPERLATFIGYLPQDTSLFAGTIKENIARFEAQLSVHKIGVDEAAVQAARSARAHDMILRQPNGYDAMLGWGGRGLSAGQAQRVGLARALYRSPPIVLLDEPNAHLDAEGEAQLVETITALKARKASVIIVAHRTGVLTAVDKILLLNAGRVDAYGKRDDVLSQLRKNVSQSESGSKKTRPVKNETDI